MMMKKIQGRVKKVLKRVMKKSRKKKRGEGKYKMRHGENWRKRELKKCEELLELHSGGFERLSIKKYQKSLLKK